MRFILYDVRDHRRQVLVDGDQWRATLAILHQSDVLTKQQANRLVWLLGGTGTSIGESETKLIADYLTMYLLPQLQPGESVTAQPEDFEFEEVTDGTINLSLVETLSGKPPRRRRPVHLSREWLSSLAHLCAGSTGLGAISEHARAPWPGRAPGRTASSE